MNESSMNGGLLAETQTQPKSSEAKSTEAAKPSEHSTSRSKKQAPRKPQKNRPRSQQERLAEVNSLLSGNSSPIEGEQEPESHEPAAGFTDSGETANAPGGGDTPSRDDPAGDVGDLSVKELAERLGTSPKKLYDSIQITTGDGETLTLGEVKDRITTQEAATREIVQRETAISERESATLQNMQLLQEVMSDLKGKLNPQTIQKLQQRTAETEARERQMMLQTMPELKDKAQLDTFRSEVADHMTAFGFRPNELVIRDHRIALAIKDAIATKRQLQKLMEFEPEQDPPKPHKPQGKQRRKNRHAETIANAASSKRPQDKALAVNAILQGAKNA